MNDFFINLQPSLMMNSPVMSPDSGALMGEGVLGDGQFQSLLSTVGDLEVADSQIKGLDVANQEMLENMNLDTSKELPVQGMNAGLSQNLLSLYGAVNVDNPVNAIGQKTSLLKEDGFSEIRQGSTLRLNLLEQQGLSDLQGLRNLDQTQSLKPQAVAAWATALASGDMKDVSLEGDPVATKMAATAPVAMAAIAPATQAEVAAVALPTEMAALNPETFSEKRDQLGAATKLGGDVKVSNRSLDSNELRVQSSEDFLSKNTNKDSGASAGEQGEKFFSGKSNAKPVPLEVQGISKSSKSAKDFMLENTYSQNTPPVAKEAPALVGAATLASPGDKRISPESINFVADKIESLKAQGGGRLKLELGSKELGGLEIQVSITGGKVNVNMMAERQETLAAFQSARGDLMQRLSGIGPAELSISHASSTGMPDFAGTSVVSAQRGMSAVENSSELLSLRDLSNSKRVQNLHTDSVGETSRMDVGTKGADSSADFQDSSQQGERGTFKQAVLQTSESSERDRGDASSWQREERRQQAREQWQDLQKRRSA